MLFTNIFLFFITTSGHTHLGPLLFCRFINDIGCNLYITNVHICYVHFVCKRIKMCRSITSKYDCDLLQQDNQLQDCYRLHNVQFVKVDVIKDLGVTLNCNLFNEYYYVKNKKNKMLHFVLQLTRKFSNIRFS